MWRYVIAYAIGVSALVAAITRPWWGITKRQMALERANRR